MLTGNSIIVKSQKDLVIKNSILFTNKAVNDSICLGRISNK